MPATCAFPIQIFGDDTFFDRQTRSLEVVFLFDAAGRIGDFEPVFLALPEAAQRLAWPEADLQTVRHQFENWRERLAFALPVLLAEKGRLDAWPPALEPLREAVKKPSPGPFSAADALIESWIQAVEKADFDEKSTRFLLKNALFALFGEADQPTETHESREALLQFSGWARWPLVAILPKISAYHFAQNADETALRAVGERLFSTDPETQKSALEVLKMADWSPAFGFFRRLWDERPDLRPRLFEAMADRRAGGLLTDFFWQRPDDAECLEIIWAIRSAGERGQLLRIFERRGELAPIVFQQVVSSLEYFGPMPEIDAELIEIWRKKPLERAFASALAGADGAKSTAAALDFLEKTVEKAAAKSRVKADELEAAWAIFDSLAQKNRAATVDLVRLGRRLFSPDKVLSALSNRCWRRADAAAAVPFLVERTKRANNADDFLEAAEKLARTGEKAAFLALAAAAERDDTGRAGGHCVELLGHAFAFFGGPDFDEKRGPKQATRRSRDRAAEALFRCLEDEHKWEKALRALARVGGETVKNGLFSRLFEPKKGKNWPDGFFEQGLVALARAGDERAAQGLLAILANENGGEKQAALAADSLRFVAEKLDEKSRSQAAARLGSAFSRAKTGLLKGAILEALATVGDGAAVAAFSKKMTEKDLEGQAGAVRGLAFLPPAQGREGLWRLRNSTWPTVRGAARRTLLRAGDAVMLDEILQKLAAADPPERLEAAEILAETHADRAAVLLANALAADDFVEIRATAAESLGAFLAAPDAEKAARAALETALGDHHSDVRKAARAALDGLKNDPFLSASFDFTAGDDGWKIGGGFFWREQAGAEKLRAGGFFE